MLLGHLRRQQTPPPQQYPVNIWICTKRMWRGISRDDYVVEDYSLKIHIQSFTTEVNQTGVEARNNLRQEFLTSSSTSWTFGRSLCLRRKAEFHGDEGRNFKAVFTPSCSKPLHFYVRILFNSNLTTREKFELCPSLLLHIIFPLMMLRKHLEILRRNRDRRKDFRQILQLFIREHINVKQPVNKIFERCQ